MIAFRVWLGCAAAVAGFATSASAQEAFTEKERAQGYSDRTILAKPRDDQTRSVAAAEARENVRVRAAFARFGDVRVIDLDPAESVDEAVRRLRATGRYEFVEPDYLMFPDATPADPAFSTQWSLNNTGQVAGGTAGADIRALAAWDIAREAPEVIVAVVDSGVALTHQDLAPNLWVNPAPTFGDVNGAKILRGTRTGDPTDDFGHGSHVAGIIGAAGNNGVGMAGVAWRVKIMALKNADNTGTSLTSDSAACIDYAVAHGAQVINCSFGGSGFSQTFFNALKTARDAGVIVVVSAGNSGINNDASAHYPSDFRLDNLIAVGNSGPADTPSASSDYGSLVELYAPGTSIPSVDFSSATGLVTKSGTSMAAPHVTGALALLRAHFPSDTYRQSINRLLRGTARKSLYATRVQTGGRLDLLGALGTTATSAFNDDFVNRAVISSPVATARSNNTGASLEPDEPTHANGNAGASLWWQWTAANSGRVTIDTLGSDFDTVLAVYTGSTLGALTPIASNDDYSTATTSLVTFAAQAGTTYHIAIAGKNGANGFVLLNVGAAPANDSFDQAVALSSLPSLQIAGTTLRATLEPGESPLVTISKPTTETGASVWYRWMAPRSGRFQIAAFSTTTDTTLGIYTGTDVAQFAVVAENDDTGVDFGAGPSNTDSLCTIEATAGTTYAIKVGTFKASLGGAFTLSITDSKWQAVSNGGALSGSAAVAADGTIYFGGGTPDRTLYAVTPDGRLKWYYSTTGTLDDASPAVGSDGTIYFGTNDGRMTALAPDRSLRWQRSDVGAGSLSVSPAIAADGTIYTHGTDGYLYALDPANGATKWRFNVNARATFGGPAISPDGTIYQMSSDQNLYALAPDGTLKWRFTADANSYATPAIDGAGNVYFTTYATSKLWSVTADGVLRWNYAAGAGSATSGSPTLSGDGMTVYFGSNNRRLHAVDAATGSARWTYSLGDSVLSSTPAVDASGVIYIGCYDNKLYAVNRDGSLRRTWDTAGWIRSSPAISGTTLYVGSLDGKLYAIELDASAATGPWPQYRANPRRVGRALSDVLAVAVAPQSRAITLDQPATLAVVATGPGQLTYQWFKNGVAIAGATTASLTIARFTAADAGAYTVTVTAGFASITTPAAALSVAPPPLNLAGRLINLSVLTRLAAPGDSFTVGYVVGGNGTSGAKPLLFRAAGPSLARFGLAGVLDDPRVQFFQGATASGENDDWGGGATLAATIARLGAFPFTGGDSKDAAARVDIATRDGSMRVSAANGGVGSVLAEIYDATPASEFTVATPRLLNLSVLKDLGAGVSLGFVIGGQTPCRVLIRAVGPTLGTLFGVGGTLADPRITLLDVNQTKIAENNDWGETPSLSEVFAQVGAFALPAGSKDAALVKLLPPGNYTAEISGAGNSTGLVLVEVYELP